MNECKECKVEINSTDDLITLEGNKVCPYCFYIYDIDINIDIKKIHDNLIDVILKDSIVKQILTNMYNNDTSKSLIFYIIFFSITTILIPFLLFIYTIN